MLASSSNNDLNGTTLRVYRYLFRQAGKPVGVHEVQSGLGLSSPSVAHYHIRKLVEEGLVRESSEGYIVDRLFFENMVRVRKSIVPFQTAYLVIFLVLFSLLLTLFKEQTFAGTYALAVLINALAVSIFTFETFRSLRMKNI